MVGSYFTRDKEAAIFEKSEIAAFLIFKNNIQQRKGYFTSN